MQLVKSDVDGAELGLPLYIYIKYWEMAHLPLQTLAYLFTSKKWSSLIRFS